MRCRWKVGLLLCGCVWLVTTGCGTQRQLANAPPPTSEQRQDKPPPLQVETEQLRLRWLEPGIPSRLVWEAKVPYAQASAAQADATGVFKNVRCVLYKEGKPTTDLRAKQVLAIQKEWRVEARGDVEAVSRVNGLRLKANEVIWFARQNRLLARGNVEITGNQFSLRAREVHLDTTLQVMRVSSP